MNVVLHAADFGELLALGHVVMDQAQPAVKRHGDGHARLSHRVHVGGNDRDVEVYSLRQGRVELGVAGQHFGIEGCERYIIVSQPDMAVSWEEGVGRLIELRIELIRLFRRCHVL